MATQTHRDRVFEELRAVGVTKFGMKKFAIHYLPKVIHKEEHIMGAVYGRYREKNGPQLSEGLLVATDLRILFIDHKPGYTKQDEISYDVVAGVKTSMALFAAVTLHTRLGDYTLRFANARCVNTFVKYIENRRLEKLNGKEISSL